MKQNELNEPLKDGQPPPSGRKAEPTDLLSKKVTANRRRFAIRDAKTIANTRAFTLLSTGRLADSSVATDNLPITGFIQASEARLPPLWEHTTDLAKVTFANRVLVPRGAFAFSLNLAPAVVMAANENR